MNISEQKIINTILFFSNKSVKKTIDRVKLIKLIWLSDRLHLNKYGRLILNDRYKALPNGPVASQTLTKSNSSIHGVFSVNGYNIKALKDFENEFFSFSDIEILEYVWNKYGKNETFFLRDLSHLFPEWLRFEKELEDNTLPNSYDIVIQDFFEFPENVDFSDILNQDIIDEAKREFNVKSSIQKALEE